MKEGNAEVPPAKVYDDEATVFCKSLIPDLRKLSPQMFMHTARKLRNIVNDAAMESDENTAHDLHGNAIFRHELPTLL